MAVATPSTDRRIRADRTSTAAAPPMAVATRTAPHRDPSGELLHCRCATDGRCNFSLLRSSIKDHELQHGPKFVILFSDNRNTTYLNFAQTNGNVCGGKYGL